MKTQLLLLGLLLNFKITNAQSWQSVQLAPASEHPLLREAKFWSDTGLIISANGKIFHSNDFFQSFTVDSTYKPNGFDAMSFSNREIGHITTCTVQGGMLKTIDGGDTWNPLSFGPATGVCIGENLLCITPDTGFSAWRENANYLWFTFDGGQNWNYNSPLPYREVFKIETVQDSFIYILQVTSLSGVLGTPNIFRTSDYGAHWQNTFNTFPNEVTRNCDFNFIDDTTLIMAVDAAILKSKNAGFSFDTVMLGEQWVDIIGDNVRSISFVGRDTGFVAYYGSVYKTYDAGDSWTKTDFAFDSIERLNGNEITFIKAISSQKIVIGCYNGNIYKTETGGGIWSGIQELEKENSFTLFPNPATSKLSIQLTNTTSTKLTYQILSTDGRVLLQNTIATQPNFEIDVSILPAGLYFLQLNDVRQRSVKKFVKQ